jgi:hypothetical protein
VSLPGFQCSAFQLGAFQEDCEQTPSGGEGGAVLNGFIINIMDGGETPPIAARMTEITAGYHADFVLPLTDSMYVVSYAGGNSIIKRYADETMPRKVGDYTTRDVILPKPESFGVLQVLARLDPAAGGVRFLTCIVTADGGRDGNGNPQPAQVFAHTFSVFSTENKPYRAKLPSGFKARRWSVSIGVDHDILVYGVHLAGTELELAEVAP